MRAFALSLHVYERGEGGRAPSRMPSRLATNAHPSPLPSIPTHASRGHAPSPLPTMQHPSSPPTFLWQLSVEKDR